MRRHSARLTARGPTPLTGPLLPDAVGPPICHPGTSHAQGPPRLPRPFLTVVLGGVAVGACLAALIPGAETLVWSSTTSTSTSSASCASLAQRSTVYDAEGNLIAAARDDQPRGREARRNVPKILQEAVISVEDKTFWKNDGVDFNSVVPRRLKNLTSGKIEQGGSTITQQLVKNRILTSKRDINRKVREIVLALRLNKKLLEARDPRAVPQHRVLRAGLLWRQGRSGAFSSTPRPFGPLPDKLARSRSARRRCSPG